MAERKWVYEKLDENGNIKGLPAHDSKGEITGKYIIGLPEYFDEHPEERIRLGWIKHIRHYPNEIKYNRQTQYVRKTVRQIDAYTVEDVLEIFDKTEEMFLLEEMQEAIGFGAGGDTFIIGDAVIQGGF